jgi:hypothetical protein
MAELLFEFGSEQLQTFVLNLAYTEELGKPQISSLARNKKRYFKFLSASMKCTVDVVNLELTLRSMGK